MKKILFLVTLILSFNLSKAEHIIGGEMFYEYDGVGSTPNTHRYKITLKLYRGNTGATLDGSITFTVFRNSNGSVLLTTPNIQRDGPYVTQWQTTNPCIINPPIIYYEVGFYRATIELPESATGYTIAYQRCCRKASISNLSNPSAQGATYFTTIPGTNINPSAVINSSPKFSDRDSSIVCKQSPFEIDFSATDLEGDSLRYRFGPAFRGGGNTQDGPACNEYRPNPACWPFLQCSYNNPPYSSTSPMGNLVTINSATGLVSGTAPNVGEYVVTVYCDEYRNGIRINSHYKEFLVRVNDCEISNAELIPDGTTCDGFLINFENKGSNTNVTTWLWLFGDPASGSLDTSRLQNPTHDYSAAGAGDYLVKLYVNKGLNCEDSAEAIFKVYPGWQPAFKAEGQCKNFPIQFTDLSVHLFGNVNKWTWNFDDPSSGVNNTSSLKNPTHVFANSGIYNVTLLVESDKGCSATIPRRIEIKDKPAFTVFPKDTLICKIDDLQIGVTGSGTVVWSPNYNISNVNIPNPIVSPDVTTTYTATFTDAFGCIGSDDVKINVVDKVTQGSDYDTTICTGDAIQLRLASNALYYTWTPNNGSLNSTTIKNPTAKPTAPTDYVVLGKISNICFAQNTIKVKPVPYPDVVAPPVSVCFGNSTQLQASGGTIYNWSPRTYLNSTTIPNPTVTNPLSSVVYTLTVRDVLGCPKPTQKFVQLNVVKINANAGPRDTSVVLGQPLQLFATGGTNFLWLPDNRWLSRTDINNPIALPQSDIEYIVQVSDANGCKGLDSIRVKLYRVAPGLYVPNAFTPNGDGKNDIFRPVVLGIKSLDLFQVYNRFGQMVYSGTDIAKGWDGTFGGRPQDPANFVWVAEATDYTGKKIKRKGNVILIRQ
jgi:gliding motility-associated-like protein